MHCTTTQYALHWYTHSFLPVNMCWWVCVCRGWQRLTGSLTIIGHFLQKWPIFSGSFVENNLQLRGSYESSLPLWVRADCVVPSVSMLICTNTYSYCACDTHSYCTCVWLKILWYVCVCISLSRLCYSHFSRYHARMHIYIAPVTHIHIVPVYAR